MAKPWYLLADIGGTNARFALAAVGSGDIQECFTVAVADHSTFISALQCYLSKIEALGAWERTPAAACLAIACATDRDVAAFTNSDWRIDRRDVTRLLESNHLHLINDFEALGYAVAGFAAADWQQIGAGDVRHGSPIAMLGAGTGLGVCAVLPTEPKPQVLSGEGGHVDFAPADSQELHILQLLLTRYPRVSLERLLSGVGLQNIYWALTQINDAEHRQATPADISGAALAGSDVIAREALKVFCRVLGSAAGNYALCYGALGGVYIAGGIAPRIIDFLRDSEFRERFLAKGRFQEYLSDVPTRIVTRQDSGLLGALKFLQHRHLS